MAVSPIIRGPGAEFAAPGFYAIPAQWITAEHGVWSAGQPGAGETRERIKSDKEYLAWHA